MKEDWTVEVLSGSRVIYLDEDDHALTEQEFEALFVADAEFIACKLKEEKSD